MEVFPSRQDWQQERPLASYTAKALSEYLAKRIAGFTVDDRDDRGMHIYFRQILEYSYSDSVVMWEFFFFFDWFLFDSALENHCICKFDSTLGDLLLGSCRLVERDGTRKALIRIGRQPDEEEVPHLKMRNVSTLLHEMLHAFFQLYAHPADRFKPASCGPTGHGYCWQDAAIVLQTYCRNKYLLQDLVVGEDSDFAVELSRRAMDEGITLLQLPAWLRRMRRVLPECRTKAWGLKWEMVVEYTTRGLRNQRK